MDTIDLLPIVFVVGLFTLFFGNIVKTFIVARWFNFNTD